MPFAFNSSWMYSHALRLMYWKQWTIVFFGCMVRRANAGSSRHLVWIYSDTHSFILRRVSFSTSPLTRCMEAATTSSSLMAAKRSICSCRAFFFSACFASHSAFRLASAARSEEHTSELQSRFDLVCRLLLEKKNRQ